MPNQKNKRRQRNVKRTVRYTPLEEALVIVNADIAGLTVASYMRQSSLIMPAPAAGHRPTVNHRLATQLHAETGQLNTRLDQAADGMADIDPALIETTFRDVSEMRLVLLETVGRAP